MRALLSRALVTLCLICAGLTAARAAEPVFAPDGVAVNGYDVVAYFTDGRPVAGKAEFTHDWNGAKWRFATA